MATYIDADIVRSLQASIDKAGSLRQWARANDFTPGYISDVISGRRDVSERLAKALGFGPTGEWKRL